MGRKRSSRSSKSGRGCCSSFLWIGIAIIVIAILVPSNKGAKKSLPTVSMPSATAAKTADNQTVSSVQKETQKQTNIPAQKISVLETKVQETSAPDSKGPETSNTTLSDIILDDVSSFDISAVPEYTGLPVTEINSNVPYFSDSELTTSSFETYGDLDYLGRCTTAFACVGTDLIPTVPRGQIGLIKPTGWHLVKYSGIDGNYLYNRCHLIAYELSGENANEKNLITGTRYLNIEGMLPYENKVADYVKSTGHHVMYRVTPIFEGENLLASGVLMEGESVEDSYIRFCVFAYNVQPGITIDYATGESGGEEYSGSETAKYDGVNFSSPAVIKTVQTALNDAGYDCGMPDGVAGSKTYAAIEKYRSDYGVSGLGIDAYLALALGLNAYDLLSSQSTVVQETPTQTTSRPPASETPASSTTEATYIVNTNTGVFHYPNCSSVGQMAEHNKWYYRGSRDELINMNYKPCQRCNP